MKRTYFKLEQFLWFSFMVEITMHEYALLKATMDSGKRVKGVAGIAMVETWGNKNER